jgi:hypothetical protein
MSGDCCSINVSTNEKAETAIEGCCEPDLSVSAAINLCRSCGSKGKKVNAITLKAMLKANLVNVRDVPYFFCRTADCEVVYFSGDGQQTFTKTQVREPVFQKEARNENALVCYCFRHSPASIRAELLNSGQSTVIAEINAGIKAGQCACEIRNPQGSCCLGNVSKVVKQIEQEAKVSV